MKEKVVQSLSFLNIDRDKIGELIEIPKNQSNGDFSFPCFYLSKIKKKAPAEIAKDILKKIDKKKFERVEASGPYVNFFVDKKIFTKEVLSKQIRIVKKENVIIEFSQPNTHKAFHVGHVRGTSLGESLARIIELTNGKVLRANYSGDTGMHIAKWIWCYKKFHKNENVKNDEKWFASIYVEAVKKLEESKLYQEEVEDINRKLDLKDKELTLLWNKTRKLSINSWKNIYKELDTKFDIHFFESEFEESGKKIGKELLNKKIAKISEGAIIVDFKDHKREDLGVLVLIRKDGTVLYGAKDLALAKKKAELNLDKSIYVIGKAQERYVYQIFEILRLMKIKSPELIYIPVNEVRFPWGKMSSRTGENIYYSDFRESIFESALNEVRERYPDLKEEETKKRANAITLSVIKYPMLKQDINKNIIFNPKDEAKFEGNTGPYLLYSYVRAHNIIKKSKKRNLKISEPDESEFALLKKISEFSSVLKESREKLLPSLIANYAYELAKEFNEFYHKCPVINNNRESFRIRIVLRFLQTMQDCLWILGIKSIKNM